MKFKVTFSGYAYVEAENAQEAEDKYWDEEYGYREEEIDEVVEVDEFFVVL